MYGFRRVDGFAGNLQINICMSKKGRVPSHGMLVRLRGAPVTVASTGRAGSKTVVENLRKGLLVDVSHTHKVFEEEETPIVLYVFANPVDVALSLRQKPLDLGCSAGANWVLQHAEAMKASRSFIKLVQYSITTGKCDEWIDLLLKRDVFGLNKHMRSYLRTHDRTRVLSFKLQAFDDPQLLRLIGSFVFLDRAGFRDFATRAGSQGSVHRKNRFETLSESQRKAASDAYPVGFYQSLPDSCVWPPRNSEPVRAERTDSIRW